MIRPFSTDVPKLRDYLVALLLVVGTVCLLGVAQQDQGITRDEAVYFESAASYQKWVERLLDNIVAGRVGDSFTVAEVKQYWEINHEHPPLVKLVAGVTGWLLHDWSDTIKRSDDTRLFSQMGAYRAAGWLFTALAVALLYLFGIRTAGRVAGITAALVYLTIPRLFFHGQLTCLDSAVTTLWLLVVYGYWRSLEQARWGVITGILFGLALATKHNAWLIPGLLLVHYLVVVVPDMSWKPLRLPRIPLVFVSMAVLGPIIFFGLWPWLWFDTIDHLKQYANFHLNHAYYNIEYLGKNWGKPPLPISYPFGMLLFTMPSIVLALALAGISLYAIEPVRTIIARMIGSRLPPYHDPWRYPARRSWLRPGAGLNPYLGLLLGANLLLPLVIIALPSTPIFGGTKHFLPAFPFIALFAGIAVNQLVESLGEVSRRYAHIGAIVLPLAVIMPGLLSTSFTHPFGLSQYNALAGGTAGAADLGLNRQFWGYATRQLLPWMNKNLPGQANVYWHDTNLQSYRSYRRNDLLRADIRYAGMERTAIRQSDYAVLLYELHFNKYEYWIWDEYGTVAPEKLVLLDGVPLVAFYGRPRAPETEDDSL